MTYRFAVTLRLPPKFAVSMPDADQRARWVYDSFADFGARFGYVDQLGEQMASCRIDPIVLDPPKLLDSENVGPCWFCRENPRWCAICFACEQKLRAASCQAPKPARVALMGPRAFWRFRPPYVVVCGWGLLGWLFSAFILMNR